MSKFIFTGSRHWTNKEAIGMTLDSFKEWYGLERVIVGDCPTGVDAMVTDIVTHMISDWGENITLDIYQAEWTKQGHAAGPIRNQWMVDDHPDAIVVGFPVKGSVGTIHCMEYALSKGMSVYNFGSISIGEKK